MRKENNKYIYIYIYILAVVVVLVVKKNMSIKEVTKSMTSDIIKWRKRIHVVNLD